MYDFGILILKSGFGVLNIWLQVQWGGLGRHEFIFYVALVIEK